MASGLAGAAGAVGVVVVVVVVAVAVVVVGVAVVVAGFFVAVSDSATGASVVSPDECDGVAADAGAVVDGEASPATAASVEVDGAALAEVAAAAAGWAVAPFVGASPISPVDPCAAAAGIVFRAKVGCALVSCEAC